ncbi:MAG: hypothetical protein K0R00_3234 [Herbinix sp.]|nr:hypothetical protein [Herbinix sp.]
MFTMKNLENVFEAAVTNKHKYIAVKIETKGSEKPEIIINPSENFKPKLEYYQGAYEEDLTLKKAKGIKIVGAVSGNDFAWIESSLA